MTFIYNDSENDDMNTNAFDVINIFQTKNLKKNKNFFIKEVIKSVYCD